MRDWKKQPTDMLSWKPKGKGRMEWITRSNAAGGSRSMKELNFGFNNIEVIGDDDQLLINLSFMTAH